LKISKGGTDKETHRNEKKLSFLYKIVNFKRGTDKKERVCLYACKNDKIKKGGQTKMKKKNPIPL
jgi:catabolite regulation protein CreA|tara:strand:+ start:473 stop:667 length:195 start_codon:yes stop_codon:yes gene_type:complete